ncbi:MAG TPA: hypothetical protein VFJ51_14345, partial [Nitrososphaeraceae archaeon]|nr:hypothetical protein [Nitrososphaeraceae archaeon]
MISADEVCAKLAEYNILLKHIVFLQNNGFVDCGKGEILGQASLLQEYLEGIPSNNKSFVEKEI